MNNFEREICKLGAKSACEWFGVTDEDFIAETDRVLRERYPEKFKTDKPATPIGGEKEVDILKLKLSCDGCRYKNMDGILASKKCNSCARNYDDNWNT